MYKNQYKELKKNWRIEILIKMQLREKWSI